MWLQILKKDLMKQKTVNIILFLFITLSTIFLASSVNNICLVMNGLETYMEYANVSDVTAVFGGEDDKEAFERWLDSHSEVTEYEGEQLCEIAADDISTGDDEEAGSFEANGASLYLGAVGSRYAKPLDSDGNDLVLESGEVAVSPGLMARNGLRVGDELRFRVSDRVYTYRIAVQTRDIMFGNEMSGMGRFVFCKEDYDKMVSDCGNVKILVYGINTADSEKVLTSVSRQGFTLLVNIYERSIYPMLYVFDMIVAGLLIVIGLCLILISLMVLRFSLSFTMEENYREIGVMKAIGMRNFSIRRIYLVKYFVIVAAGAFVGFWLSIPVAGGMTDSVSNNMVLGNSADALGINAACSLAVVAFVTAMCVAFTRKMKKVSAIEAIRSGGSGERYQKRRGLCLYRRRYMGTISFLGFNDILCNMKRYLVLFLTFCISFVLITVPLNTLTTMESDEMASKFSLDPDAAIYMDTIEAAGEAPYHNTVDMENALRRIERELSEQGYEASLSVGSLCFAVYTVNDEGKVIKPLTYYPIGENGGYCEYSAGEAPRLENEVAFSKKIMDENHLEIGDTVALWMNEEIRSSSLQGTIAIICSWGKAPASIP